MTSRRPIDAKQGLTLAFILACIVCLVTLLASVDSNFGAPVDMTPLDKKLTRLHLPPGFAIEIYADKVPGARQMVLSPEGTLFVGTRLTDGPVYALPDANHDGKVDQVLTIAKHMFQPNGVAVRDGDLYVAEISTIWRLPRIESDLNHPPKPIEVSKNFPQETHHGWKYIRFGPDGLLYVPVGMPCNVCERSDKRFGSILRMKPDGQDVELYANGIRNCVGFDWQPDTKELWFTDNGRDWLGDNFPPDELNYAPHIGMNFGFPYRSGDNSLDPQFGVRAPADAVFTPPAQDLGPHVASLGMRFYNGNMFPPQYLNRVFIAEHGSWNRSVRIGYRVTMVTISGGKGVKYEPFIDGWLDAKTGVSWGRPVDVCLMSDGSMLISDDMQGAIYRVTYRNPSL